jgi:hypothetical protein
MNNSEQRLQHAINELPKEVQPTRDLWQGIELGIERRQLQASQDDSQANTARQKSPYLALAASFAFVAMLGLLVKQQWQTSQPELVAGQSNAAELAQLLSNQHQLQRDELLVSYQDQPAATENWQQQLQELDDAAAAIKAALQQDPNNTALLKMLHNVYQQQIGLIERVYSPAWRQI